MPEELDRVPAWDGFFRRRGADGHPTELRLHELDALAPPQGALPPHARRILSAQLSATTMTLLPDALRGAGEPPAEGGFGWIVEICPVRGTFALVAGYGMGCVFGLMMAGMAVSQPHLEPFSGVPLPDGTAPKVPLLRQIGDGLRDMKNRSLSTGKSFALVGGVYATVECFLERLRGRRDMRNALASGFVTGAVLAARAGPSAMAIGGAGFAAFSGIMELVVPYVFG